MTPYERLCTDLLVERFSTLTPPPPEPPATASQIADLLAELYDQADEEEVA